MKIIQSSNDQNSNVETSLSTEDHKLLMKYKELIRKQDEQLTVLKKQLTDIKTEKDFFSHQLNEQHSIIQQLRDQIALLKVQKSLYPDPLDSSPANANTNILPENNQINYSDNFNSTIHPQSTMDRLNYDSTSYLYNENNINKTDDVVQQMVNLN